MELLCSINNKGTTVLLVTHDIKVASKSERVLYMLDGRIAAELRLGKCRGCGTDALEREKQLTDWLFAIEKHLETSDNAPLHSITDPGIEKNGLYA